MQKNGCFFQQFLGRFTKVHGTVNGTRYSSTLKCFAWMKMPSCAHNAETKDQRNYVDEKGDSEV